MHKSISIVIPAYNEERILRDCLDAVAAQTEAPDEVIVVDNNSTDRTAAIARSYPFVRLVTAHRQGIVYARNAGFNAATSDIIGRIDADVVLPSGWVHYVRRFYQNPAHQAQCLTGNGRPANLRFARLIGWSQGQIAFRFNRFLMGHYILYGSNMAIPRPVWRAVRDTTCSRTDIHEDLDLAIHAHRQGYQIAYRESLRVDVRFARVTRNFSHLLDNLMLWPQTLRVHGLKTWVFGWLGAIFVYVMAVFPWLFERLARLAGRKPLDA